MAGTYTTNTSGVSDGRSEPRHKRSRIARKRGASSSHVYNIEHIATPLQSDATTEQAIQQERSPRQAQQRMLATSYA